MIRLAGSNPSALAEARQMMERLLTHVVRLITATTNFQSLANCRRSPIQGQAGPLRLKAPHTCKQKAHAARAYPLPTLRLQEPRLESGHGRNHGARGVRGIEAVGVGVGGREHETARNT